MDPEQGELKYMVHFSMHLNPFPFLHYVFCRRFSLALWKNVFSYTQTQGLLGGHCHSLAELWDIGTSKHTQSSHWFHLYSDFPCAFMAPAPKVYNKLGHFISVFPWKHFGTFWPGRMSWHCWKDGDFSCMCCLSWGGREAVLLAWANSWEKSYALQPFNALFLTWLMVTWGRGLLIERRAFWWQPRREILTHDFCVFVTKATCSYGANC